MKPGRQADSTTPSEGARRLSLAKIRAWERVLELEERGALASVEARRARRRYLLRYGLPGAVVGLVILAALAAINFLWFAAVGSNYLGWYLANGATIAFVFAVVVVAVDLDGHPALIAADPIIFAAGMSRSSQNYWLVRHSLRSATPRSRSRRDGAGSRAVALPLAPPGPRSRLPLLLIFAAAMLAWALVVAPLQYWVNLVCGAPGRMSLASWRTVWCIKHSPQLTEYCFAPREATDFVNPQDVRELEEAREHGRATEITFATKPVTFAAALASAFLWGISQLA
jgi:hypothetical protein